MILDIKQIKNELQELEETYHQMVFKNKNSLNTLLDIYKRMNRFRAAIIAEHPDFSQDSIYENIVDELEKLIANSKVSRERLEWAFYHYNDLLIFKVKDLQISIELELV